MAHVRAPRHPPQPVPGVSVPRLQELRDAEATRVRPSCAPQRRLGPGNPIDKQHILYPACSYPRHVKEKNCARNCQRCRICTGRKAWSSRCVGCWKQVDGEVWRKTRAWEGERFLGLAHRTTLTVVWIQINLLNVAALLHRAQGKPYTTLIITPLNQEQRFHRQTKPRLDKPSAMTSKIRNQRPNTPPQSATSVAYL